MPPSVVSMASGPSATYRSNRHAPNIVTQPQETPLSRDALIKVNNLKTANQKALDERITAALDHILTATDLINNRGYEDRVRYNNKKRKVNEDNEEEPNDDQQKYEQLQDKIQTTTKLLDLGFRQVVDDRVWLENVPNALDHVSTKSSDVATRAIRPTRGTQDEDDMDGEDQADPDDTTIIQPEPSENSTALLHAALSTHETMWNSKTLTQRYAFNNDYTGFKRVLWDTNHQGENAPPVPHASLWFAAEEGREQQASKPADQHLPSQSQSNPPNSTQNMVDLQSDTSSQDSDIEIQSEKTRLTCPITLQPFTYPLTSTKCPHTFEKAAIETLLSQSHLFLPLTPSQQTNLSQQPTPQARHKLELSYKTPMVQCPECVMQLTLRDLRPNPALMRKVKRTLERQRREEEADQRRDNNIVDAEDEEDEDELPRLSQRRKVVNLGSSPARSLPPGSGRRDVKREKEKERVRERVRESVVPQTQLEDPHEYEDEDTEEEEEEDDDEEMDDDSSDI